MSLNTNAATWVTGTVVTAAQLNLEVRDAVNGIQAVWDTYAPSLLGSTTNPVMNNGVIVARYIRRGKTVDRCQIDITFGTTTTYGSGTYFISLPFNARATTPGHVGSGFAAMGSTRKPCAVEMNTFTNVLLVRADTGALVDNAGPGVAWTGGGGILRVDLGYEAA